MSAQDLFLISGGGTHSSGSGGSVSWSIGEVVIQPATSSGNHVTQGFHQEIFMLWELKNWLKLPSQFTRTQQVNR
ncbi:MAG: hypothetical protein IPG07_19580 [Crocinitomicaceae bacterium]|nr:hypothetical protein [Crocinitomicaceae bacterium]